MNKLKNIFYKISLFFYFFCGLFLLEHIPYLKKNYFPLWRFINKMFISNLAVLFTSFILPIIFVLIFANIMKTIEIFPGIMAQVPVLVLCINIPMLLVNFRKSSVLKRLSSSDIKRGNILLSFVFYGIYITLISALMLFLITLALFGNKTTPTPGSAIDQVALINQLANVNWLSFLFSFVLTLIIASGVGILIAKASINEMVAMAIGLFILIPGGFLSAQYLPPYLITSTDALNYASYFAWQKYPTNLMISAFGGHNIFAFKDYIIESVKLIDVNGQAEPSRKKIIFISDIESVIYVITCLVSGPALFILGLKTFRWTNR